MVSLDVRFAFVSLGCDCPTPASLALSSSPASKLADAS
jgi:hypothetical protein